MDAGRMTVWFVRGLFTVTWMLCFAGMVVGEGVEFMVAAVLFVVVPFVYVGILEELGD